MDRKSRNCKYCRVITFILKLYPANLLKFCHDASFRFIATYLTFKSSSVANMKGHRYRTLLKNSFRYKSYVKFYIEFNRFDDDLYVYEYHMFLSPYWFLWNAWRNKHQNNV